MTRAQATRCLAINFGGIGDEILFLPTLASIRKAHPDWHITLLLEPRSQSVGQVTELADSYLTFDIKKQGLSSADLLELLGKLRNGGFDVVVSSGSSAAVAILLFLSGIKQRIGYSSGGAASRLLTNPVQLNRKQYAAFMYHDLVAGLGIDLPPQLPTISLPAANVNNMKSLLEEASSTSRGGRQRIVLMHPGTSRLAVEKGIIKTWEACRWAELVELLCRDGTIVPVLAGGPDDNQTVAEILRLTAGMPLLCTAGNTRSLADLAALIYLADLLVCVDSAPMHLGVALNKPLVALFGPTDESLLLPQSAHFVPLRGAPLSSNPQRDLFAGTGVQIPVDTVYRAVMDQLSANASRESFPECHR